MSNKGVFVATFMEGNQNYPGKRWVYPGCVTYTMEHMRKLVEDLGLAVERLNVPHPSRQIWMRISAPSHKG